MFFFLSKILAYLIMPFVIICALFILSAFLRKPSIKKRLFLTGLSLLIFFSNGFIANELMILWEVPMTPFSEITRNYQWAILLTGVTKFEEGPRDRISFNRGADRVYHTVQLYKMGKIKKILVSGGSGRLTSVDIKEADEVAEALIVMGVPPEDITKESNSRNTHESALAVKRMLEGISKPADCLLVTSGYHMRRSAACFSKVGWRVDCFSVDFLSHKRSFTPDDLVIPKLEALGIWQVLLKEWVGMISYKLAGYA